MSKLVEGAKDSKTVVFPNTVRESSGWKVSCTSIQSVLLNEGLETFESKIFRNSKIKRIVIPKNVTEIEYSAFEDCKNLK